MLWIPVDRTATKPLIRQVYDQLRIHILHGELPAGTRLPSTRELAADLHVSRNVILEAYDQLTAEGYIESRPGSGTYVAEGAYLPTEQDTFPLPSMAIRRSSVLSKHIIDFRSGQPALDLFPRNVWSRLTRHVYATTPSVHFGYDMPEGRHELRNTLSHYLLRTRGVRCHPDQIVITSGASQAFSIIARLLLAPGDRIIFEDPSNYEIHTIYSLPGTIFCPIPVDEHGMRTSLLSTQLRPAFVMVTPSHQFPLGGILPIQRRIQLIEFARATNCYIIEDDYDSEFRYRGTPISSLQGLAPEHVIYIGTFSKIISPALRLGYMVLPPSLVQSSRQIKRLSDLHSPSLDQLILAQFIAEGHLERHILKMKRVYRQRRDTLIDSLQAHFADRVQILGDATGLHLVAAFRDMDFTTPAIEQAQLQVGVRLYPVEAHALDKGQHKHEVILGYGNLSKEQIREGVRRIAALEFARI